MAKEFTYKMNIDAEIGALLGKLKTVKTSLANITSDGKEAPIARSLESIATKIDSIKARASTPIRTEATFGNLIKDTRLVDSNLDKLKDKLLEVAKKSAQEKIQFLPENEQKRLNDIINTIKNYDATIERSGKATKELTAAENKRLSAERQLAKAQQTLANAQEALPAAKEARDAAKAALDEAKARSKAADAAQDLYDKIQKLAQARKKDNSKLDLRSEKFEYEDGEGKKQTTTISGAAQKRDQARALSNKDDLQALRDAYQTAGQAVDSLNTRIGNANSSIEIQTKAVDQATKEWTELNAVFEANKAAENAKAFADMRQQAQELGVSLEGVGTENTAENIELLRQRMNECVEAGIIPVNQSIQENVTYVEELKTSNEGLRGSIEKNIEAFRQENDTAGQVNGLMNRIKQFTGITGVALVMRRALRSAIQTTKELDKQMTEMAVVTDLEVGDYWKQLPQHTEQANKLGVAIKDVYEAETLYYQQGLKTAQVQKLSTSTLKMARIAGLSAEDATNKMTAALRGFNMEINETNADRIADVYSKLAAITASNVKEISSAMTKTASLASNAGMEFETTAAFLAQIIETTRESAETAGTALKTVIARFQELKKSPDEIGEVEGEIVDANKIETALRTVGVALRDAQGQFRNLDEVFLELSSKWDSLDTNTQRYIATIAAGSRQQSRFIAMMSDYARTQELVNAANTAAGASNEQFEKTLQSLQSKLAQLKNAWDTFTQGLANNEFIKAAVGLLTGFLNLLNKVTQGFDSFSGSALKIGVVTAALIAGDKAIRIFTTSLKTGTTAMGAFGNVFVAAGQSIRGFFTRLAYGIKGLTTNNKTLIVGGKVVRNFSAEQTKLKAAQDAAAAASNRVTVAQNNLDAALNSQTPTMMAITKAQHELDVAKGEAITANNELITQEGAFAASLGLTSDQMTIYTGLTEANVGAEQAAILASKGITTAKLDELAVNSGLTREQLISIITQKEEAKSKLGGALASTLAAKAAQMEGKGKIRSAIASKLAAIANWMFNASLGVLLVVIFAVIAAIALLVVGILLLVKAFKEAKANTPEGKLKTANEVLKQTTKIANEAKESYDNLKDSFEELNNKYDALDDMTVGTQEWRDALLEVNNQVMDLIDKYPQLANAVEIDSNGVMRISEEAQKQVQQEQAMVVARTQSAKLAAQIAKNQAQANYDYSKLSNKAVAGDQARDTWAGIGAGAALGASAGSAAGGIGAGIGAVGGAITGGFVGYANSREANKGLTDQLAQALSENEIQFFDADNGIDKEKLKQYMTESMGMAGNAASQWLKDLDEATLKKLKEYGDTLNKNAKAQEAALQSMITNSMTAIDLSDYSNEQIQQMNSIGIELVNSLVKGAEIAVKNLPIEEYKKEAKKYYEDLGYTDIEFDKNGNIKYKDENGSQSASKSVVESQLKTAKATEELTDKLELLPKALDKVLTQKGGEALNNAFKDTQGKALTRSDLTDLTDMRLAQIYENNEELQAIYENFEVFLKEMRKRTELANQAFEQNTARMDRIGLGQNLLPTGLTSDAEKGLTKKLEEIVSSSGVEAGRETAQAVNTILSHVAAEDRNNLMAQLNGIDWHDATALEKLPETLQQLDYILPEKELNDLIAMIKINTKAIHKIDMDKLNENLLSLTQSLNNIRINEQGRTFEDDIYKQVIAANATLAKDFVQNIDGTYTYIGNSLEDLKNAILEKSEDLVKEEQTRLEAALGIRDTLDQMALDPTMNIDKMASKTTADMKDFLKELIQEANPNDLDALGIDYLSSDTDINKIEDREIIKQMIKDLQAIGTKVAIQDKINSSVLKALTTSNLDQDAYFNTRTDVSYKAQMRSRSEALTEGEVVSYRSQRQALLSQANSIGITEEDVQTLMKYNQQLEEMEDALLTNTRDYKDLAKQTNKLMRQVQKKTSFETMYKAMEANVGKSYELLQTLQSTTSAMQRQQIVAEMMSEFELKATENNYEQLAQLTEAYLHGNYDGFIRIIQLSGEAAGVMGDAYHDLDEQYMTNIQAMGQEAYDFAVKMIDAGYGWVDSITNRFHWGAAELKDIIDDIVDDIDRWVSPYNWLYNQNNLINAQLRERERIERNYQMMLEDGNATVTDLSNNLARQAALIRENSAMQKNVYDQADKELRAYVDYFNNTQGFEAMRNVLGIGANGGLVVDKEKLYDAKLSADAGSVVEAEIGKIEELIDTMHSAEDALQDNEDALRELNKTGKEQYNSALDRVTEGLRITYQREIDKLTAINDTITEAQEKLADKIQEKIDDDREAREEEKARENLTDKQTQLAYLRASGGSALEILQLQKDIENDQESYTDSLVDKSLKELQDANQKAADQRQEQIDIAQAQYDFWSEYDAVHDAEELLNASLKEISEGLAPEQTGMAKLLYGTENVRAQSKEGIEDWYKELGNTENLAAIHAGLVGVDGVTGSITTFKAELKDAQVDTTSAIQEVQRRQETYSVGKTSLVSNVKSVQVSAGDISNNTDEWARMLADIKNKVTEIKVPNGAVEVTSATSGTNIKTPTLTTEEAKAAGKYSIWQGWQAGETLKGNKNIGSSADVYAHMWKLNNQDYYHDDKNNQYFSASDISWNDKTSSFEINAGATAIKGGWAVNSIGQSASQSQSTLEPEASQMSLNEVMADKLNQLEEESGEAALLRQKIKQTDLSFKNKTTGRDGWDRGSLYFNPPDNGLTWESVSVTMESPGNAELGQIAKTAGIEDKTLFTYEGWLYAYNNGLAYLLRQGPGLLERLNILRNDYNLNYKLPTTFPSFMTGGLANFTGPAWMDGTRTNPELVLNQTDTANFIELKNVLAELLRNSSNPTLGGGNNYYDIDVHVDSIDSDYDIDSAAARMKELIEDDAMYRNVNAIQQIR